MTSALLRTLAALTVALIFAVTLMLNWPLAGLTGLLAEKDGPQLAGANGTLTDGGIERIAFTAGGWPLALGPLEWHFGWPPGVRLQLGRAPGAWRLDGTVTPSGSRWQLDGGDMAALDLSRLPVAIAARWEGRLDIRLAGRRCVASEGALTTADIRLLTPAPISMGHARLRPDCSTPQPRLLLEIDDGEALRLSAELRFNAEGGGEGELSGFIAATHPLADWRELLQSGASSERIEQHFSW